MEGHKHNQPPKANYSNVKWSFMCSYTCIMSCNAESDLSVLWSNCIIFVLPAICVISRAWKRQTESHRVTNCGLNTRTGMSNYRIVVRTKASLQSWDECTLGGKGHVMFVAWSGISAKRYISHWLATRCHDTADLITPF